MLLRPHSYRKRHSDTMFCPHCNKNKAEHSKPFIILCPPFCVMRRTLFDEIEQEFIANFKILSVNQQFKITKYRSETNNPEIKNIDGHIKLSLLKYKIIQKLSTTSNYCHDCYFLHFFLDMALLFNIFVCS